MMNLKFFPDCGSIESIKISSKLLIFYNFASLISLFSQQIGFNHSFLPQRSINSSLSVFRVFITGLPPSHLIFVNKFSLGTRGTSREDVESKIEVSFSWNEKNKDFSESSTPPSNSWIFIGTFFFNFDPNVQLCHNIESYAPVTGSNYLGNNFWKSSFI